MVEHYLDTVGVVGSIPIAPTKNPETCDAEASVARANGPTAWPTATTDDPIEDALAAGIRALGEAVARARVEDLVQLGERMAVLARKLEAPIVAPLDVSQPGELEALFERIAREWGRLDIVVHSIAWAPKGDLQGRFRYAVDTRGKPNARLEAMLEPSMLAGWRADSGMVWIAFPPDAPDSFRVNAVRRGGRFVQGKELTCGGSPVAALQETSGLHQRRFK